MKKSVWLVLGILACLAVTAGAYFWANGMINSLYAYRSPLHNSPPAPGDPLGKPLTRKVVLVLIDGLREDTSLKSEVMPFLNELRTRSASATMHSRPPSFSDPGYSVLLTGAWPDISDGPALNLPYEETPTFTQDDLFSAVHRAGLRTAISANNWFEKLIPQASVDASFYTAGDDAAADREVMDAAPPMLEGDYALVLIHIDQVDYAGHHEGGPLDSRWDAAAARSDELLREIVTHLDLSQDTVIVLSDHGHIDRGGHGGQDPIALIEPFVITGAGVIPGMYGDINMVDVAPTIAALLGANIPASNQGHVLTNMLNLSDMQLAAIHDAVAYQQIQLEQTYIPAIGERATNVLVEPGQDVVNSYQQAMDAARSQRLFRERTWRGLLALFLATIPAAILVIRRDRKVLWLLCGALLYVLLFNFRYAILGGRTYSLSSPTSEMDIIMFVAVTGTVALTIAWLAVMLILRAFRHRPLHAASTSLSLTLMTIYLLAIPNLLSYSLNGALVTWALPDMLSMFVAFLSVIQCLVVAAFGLLLTGIAALVAWLVVKRT